MPIREDEEIALSISEEFARFLFGFETGPIFRNDPRAAGAGPGDVAGYMPFSPKSSVRWLLKTIGDTVIEDYMREHPIKKIVTTPVEFRSNGLGIQVVESSRRTGNKTAIAFIYGQWNELGPRLVLRWLIDNPRTSTIEIATNYMKKLKYYSVGERPVSARMSKAKQSMREYNTAKEELEERDIPENVIKYVLSPKVRNETNKAAPLSRLVKNKRGGSRRTRRQTRRLHH